MNFFEHQDRAQRRTRWLLLLFGLAVLAIVVVVNVIVLVVFDQTEQVPRSEPWLTPGLLADNTALIIWTTVLTAGLIGLGSLYRTVGLRDGGGTVARELGGTRVDGDVQDPLRRRLRNVVEEIAIASGVPVPEIYVLEQELGINAFAAGYSPDDAAIAVTRGALERLDREELQGVVAHEFGHVLNGDMRLNIRLMGLLFGILVLALVGQRIMLAMRFSRNNRNAGGLVAAGLALVVAGYVGLFFARWIRASVSRQREYLADASAVQFTRHPEGIAGALKKIGAAQAGMQADTEEVGHMLFASGALGQLFATHPPLEKRIQAIEPNFKAQELEALRERMRNEAREGRAEQQAQAEARAAEQGKRPDGPLLNPEALTESIGDPGLAQILGAALLVGAMPGPLERAAHSDAWGVEVLLYLLINADSEVRDKQLLEIARVRGADSESRVGTLLDAAPVLRSELKLPLMEMSFPVVRRRPPEERHELLPLIDALIQADGRVSAFEYAMGRLLRRQLHDLERPGRARAGGREPLRRYAGEVRYLLTILAGHGHPEDPPQARAALQAGIDTLDGIDPPGGETTPPPNPADQRLAWAQVLDRALESLDRVRPREKELLIAAMTATVTHGGETTTAEVELLRAVAGALHVPLPPAGSDDRDSESGRANDPAAAV